VKVTLKTDPSGGLLHPPSNFAIGGNRGFLFYTGQPRVCRICGQSGHEEANCSSSFCRNSPIPLQFSAGLPTTTTNCPHPPVGPTAVGHPPLALPPWLYLVPSLALPGAQWAVPGCPVESAGVLLRQCQAGGAMLAVPKGHIPCR